MAGSSKKIHAAPDDRLIEQRCWKKAEAARWAAECQRRLREGYHDVVEEIPSDAEVAQWAERMTNDFYWSSASKADEHPDLGLLDDLGGCFEVVASALALARGVADSSAKLEHVLPLVAEAQSALRAAIRRIGASDDVDQGLVFDWLTTTAARHRIFIKRYMRADSPADPTRWADLLSRVEKLADRHDPSSRHSQHELLFDRLRLRLDDLSQSGGTQTEWRAVIEAVDQMVSEGMPPSNRSIRDLLLPLINELPDAGDLPPGFRLVLREIDRFLARRSSSAEAPVSRQPTPDMQEVARSLAGKSVVLIGGSRRREAQGALERAFALHQLIWIETKEHQAVATFEPMIARRDVALVLLAIRWSSHSFADVKAICDRHDTPLVRLPGGYNPNQVAAQIIAQSSGQLTTVAKPL
jgi:hypothetical protein